MSDNNVQEVLKEALTKSYERGYGSGRVDALKALSISLQFCYDLGILSGEEKKGYKIALDTVNATVKILEQDTEEAGI